MRKWIMLALTVLCSGQLSAAPLNVLVGQNKPPYIRLETVSGYELELLREVHRGGFDGAIYFDTFPDASGLDPVAECGANIRTVKRMLAAVARMEGDCNWVCDDQLAISVDPAQCYLFNAEGVRLCAKTAAGATGLCA